MLLAYITKNVFKLKKSQLLTMRFLVSVRSGHSVELNFLADTYTLIFSK